MQLWRTHLSSHLIGSILRTGRFGDLAEGCRRAGCPANTPMKLPPTQPGGPARPVPSTLHTPALLWKKLPGIQIRGRFELLMLHSCSTLQSEIIHAASIQHFTALLKTLFFYRKLKGKQSLTCRAHVKSWSLPGSRFCCDVSIMT